MGKKTEITQIPEVKDGMSINELIKEFNDIVKEWTDIYSPITAARKKTLDSCDMAKKPGSTIKNALLGLIVTMVSDLNISLEDFKKAITFKDEAQYIGMNTVEKYMEIYESIKAWVLGYVDVKDRCQGFIDKLTEIPGKATEIVTNAPSELEDSGLGAMDLMKVVKGTKDSVSKIKNVAEALTDQMKAVPVELTTIMDASKALQEAIESGKLIELGKKCREDKVGENILACYEHSYGKIEPAAGESKDGAQGCCITF